MSGKIRKTLEESCLRLSKSGRRFEDIFNIVFSNEGVFSKTYKNGETEELSYRKAKETIERLSVAIYKRVGSGKYLGLYGNNCAEWLLLFWAILKSGNKPYLINLRQPEGHISSMLATLSVEYILCTLEKPLFFHNTLLYRELVALSADETVSTPRFADEIAITTSGTTLQEKICLYSGREISAQILNSREAVERNPRIIQSADGEIRMLMLLPLYHIFGLVASYLWFLFTGAVFVFSGERSTAALLKTAQALKVTHVFSVPLLWHGTEQRVFEEVNNRSAFLRGYLSVCLKVSYFLQNLFPGGGLIFPKIFLRPLQKRVLGSGVRFCISGGSYLNASAMKFVCSMGYPLFSGYGSTEIGIASVDFSRKPKDRAFPSAGKNFSSVEFEIRSNGRLFVRGESVCKKQIIEQKLTHIDGWFDTGDVVFRDEKNKYHIAGRESDIVISDNGENLNPDLAEQAFVFSFIKNFSVLGDEKNERLILVLHTDKELNSVETETLKIEILSGIEKLPASYRIREVFTTKAPLLSSDEIKISRTRLRNSIKEGKTELFAFDITK